MKKAALLAALAISLTGLAQNGKPGFQKGQKLEVTTETKREFSSLDPRQPMDVTVTSTFIDTYDVRDVTPGGSVLEQKIKRLAFKAGNTPGKDEFDSDKESDLNGQMGKALKKDLENKYILTLDPSGRITAVKLDNTNAGEEDDPVRDLILFTISQLGIPSSAPQAGTASIFCILPTRSLKQGDTWTDSSSAKGFRQKIVYTVTGITDNEIMLDFTEDLDLESRKDIMGSEAILSSKNRSAGKIIVDSKTGILRQKTFTTNAEGLLKGGGGNRPSKEKITTTITVK